VQDCDTQVCVPGRLQVCGNGPLQVCGDVGQLWNVPLQVSGRRLPQVPKLQTPMVAPLHDPPPPLHCDPCQLLQVPTDTPLHFGGL
jgi:hypothetical protein